MGTIRQSKISELVPHWVMWSKIASRDRQRRHFSYLVLPAGDPFGKTTVALY
jgi:hypothetical protein